ncbi:MULTISPECIES: hypothetical protein [Aestuariimicrobium]|uniref:hypothetical protein n=1 Tax=Aestuariimicrobium TaxID=396388 RepID=UPI0003B5BAAD|nr:MULTISPECIES: hypothetical protein [Aestuariimicrobium]CAI9408261.1 hypothetical protein AESSP_01992 [Aestuariimicrobium sp. T2.26MG-19.2B]
MKPTKIVGIISFVAGLVMIVAGAVTWGVVTSQLKDERITVAADAAPVMGIKVAGKNVAGPITAFGQAEIIKHHATTGSDGKTYAELGALQNGVKTKAKDLGVEDLTSTDPAVVSKIEADPTLTELKGELAKYTAQRTTQMNGAFLRTSLFSSVITYGVSAFVIGMGLMNLLYGWAFVSVSRKHTVAE